MENNQNTPPHVDFRLILHEDLQVNSQGLHNSSFEFKGCQTCAINAIAAYMEADEKFRKMILTAIGVYSVTIATKQKKDEK